MRMTKLVGRCIKETPKDAQTASHKFLIRGGYARPISAGIYALLPLGLRVAAKVEQIIREEMNAIEGQELLMPVVLPKELWEESGRYQSVGPELLRFKDRNDKEMLLAMTHEEVITHLTRGEVTSYKQLPVMLYQFQTKYRDEARPRAGLIRVREFTMKDGYSFHVSQPCLEAYYKRAHQAYERIFRRVGLRDVASIESNSGIMGGAVSHEFMALAECGEDTIFMSPGGEYKANREIARAAWKFPGGEPQPLEKVATPGKKSIEEVSEFLGVRAEQTGKAVFYVDNQDTLIFAMIRGDFEVNESKLKNHLHTNDLNFANDIRIRKGGAEPGYASPLGLDPKKVRVIVDPSVVGTANLVVGANEADCHFKNFNFSRDLPPGAEIVEIATVRDGDPCPVTGAPLLKKRGIEVGNIFQLGTKYSSAMNCNFLDANGKSHPMIMGCYDIGVGRTVASVVKQNSDEWGPLWPISVAPFHVHICALNLNKPEVSAAAEKLYAELLTLGVETLYDDRGEKAGFAFSDADLIGVPLRVVISPKTLEAGGKAELKRRGSRDAEIVPLDNLATTLKDRVQAELAQLR